MSDHRLGSIEGNGDAARLLDAAGRQRLAAAMSDLLLPQDFRLTEWHRTTMAALLGKLVRSIEDDLRAALTAAFDEAAHPELHAALGASNVEIAWPILRTSRALEDSDLVALLLRRTEEHRLHRASFMSGATGTGNLLGELVNDDDPQVAEGAMAFLIAQSRRLDRFQEPVLATTELPAEIEHRLVWTIAAALRVYLVDRHDIAPATADEVLADAARRRLAALDEGEALEPRASHLARRLYELGRLDGAFLARALREGGLPLLLAGAAARCGISFDAAWQIMSDPRGSGPVMLLKAGDLDRADAVAILLDLRGGIAGAEDRQLVRQTDQFDGSSPQEARDALRLWQVDPAYRAALAKVSSRRCDGIAV